MKATDLVEDQQEDGLMTQWTGVALHCQRLSNWHWTGRNGEESMVLMMMMMMTKRKFV